MPYIDLRFHVMWRRTDETEFRDFFQTDDIAEAKDFAMRLAFDETNVVYVEDHCRHQIVRNFDDPDDRRDVPPLT